MEGDIIETYALSFGTVQISSAAFVEKTEEELKQTKKDAGLVAHAILERVQNTSD